MTFACQFGRNRYKWLPFGAAPEGDMFQRKIDEIFKCQIHLALKTNLYSPNWSTHLSPLENFQTTRKGHSLRPLLKKIGLSVIFKNFRPVLNLSYASKLIECVVSQQLIEFTKESGMVEPLQSAYRSQHSTETALLKVKADILHAMDNQKVTCLIILDLSMAFDTVSHSLLLNRLKFRFGLGGTIIEWLKSYLAGYTQ